MFPVASPQDKQTNTEEDLKARRQDEDSRLEPGEGFAAQDRGKRETNCTHRAGVVAMTGAVHGAHKSISDGREASQRDQRTKADGRRPRRRAKGARPGKERTADWLRGRKEEQRACTGEGDRKERERCRCVLGGMTGERCGCLGLQCYSQGGRRSSRRSPWRSSVSMLKIILFSVSAVYSEERSPIAHCRVFVYVRDKNSR